MITQQRSRVGGLVVVAREARERILLVRAIGSLGRVGDVRASSGADQAVRAKGQGSPCLILLIADRMREETCDEVLVLRLGFGDGTPLVLLADSTLDLGGDRRLDPVVETVISPIGYDEYVAKVRTVVAKHALAMVA